MEETNRNLDKILFRTAVSKPDLFAYLVEYDALSHPGLIEIAREISELYQKTGDIVDLSIYEEQIPDFEDYKDILKPVNLTDSMIELACKNIKKISENQVIFELAESVLEGKSVGLEDIIKIWKKSVFEYEKKIEDRFDVTSINDIYKILTQIEGDEVRKLTSGFNNMDQVLKGGWRAGSSYCVMGLTGIGKSIFLANFAGKLWKKKKNVLYVTTEMNHRQTFDRIFRSAFSCKTIDDIRIVLLKAKDQDLGGEHIEVIKVHPNDTSCSDIQNEVDQLDWTPDVILIDYFDEVRASEKTASEYEKHGIVAADMKKLAEINDCPVITATQTNRSAAGEKGGTKSYVGMESVADSHKKVRTLDVLFSIIQEPYMKNEDGMESFYELHVIKNRYGQTSNRLCFKIKYASMSLSECGLDEIGRYLPDAIPEETLRAIRGKMDARIRQPKGEMSI